MSQFKLQWPHTIRARLMLLIVPLVSLSIILTGYFLGSSGQRAILQEKERYLLGVTRLVATHLAEQGGYSGLAKTLPAADVAAFNQQLAPFTENVAQNFPGLGVGYYHRHLDAILTYGPAAENGKTVGHAIGPTHPGRQVMATGQPAVSSGMQVRGNIMNAMTPIVEGGEVVGYVWANELIDDIDRQIAAMRQTVLLLGFATLCFSLLLTYWIVTRLTKDVSIIQAGLGRIGKDLKQRIPPLKGETGDIAKAINSMAHDLGVALEHEKQLAEAALRQTEETLQAAIAAIDEGFVLYDPDDKLVTCNEKYLQVHQGAADLMVPGTSYEFIVRACAERGLFPQANGRIDQWVAERTAQHRSGHADVEVATEDGRWLRILDRKTATGHIVGFRIDVTDLKRATESAQAANRKLEELVSRDGLTGLDNRRSMDMRTDEAWGLACEQGSSFAILMIDVDNFKKYNDHYGHQDGDDCLRAIAKALSDTVDGSNAANLTGKAFAARYGGEEFAVIIPQASRNGYVYLANAIVVAIRQCAIPHEKNAEWGVVTASVGGAFIERAEGGLAQYFRQADRQLYIAKENGRNRAELA
jgi:diguanylate cyclase (GGDEF)-like protein